MSDAYASFVNRLVSRPEPAPPAPPHRSNAIVVGRDDHRPFLGASDVPDLARLTRYQVGDEPGQGTFQALSPGALSEVPRIHIFVHGWSPGSKIDADLLYATEGEVITAWDSRIRNSAGTSLAHEYVPLLESLARRDPDSAVLWFSWVDQSGTDTGLFAARSSLHKTGINGRRLALAVQQAIGRGSAGIHLIGHSHGCIVSTTAALSLERRPAQLTLLDCPENWFSRTGGAAGLLNHVLPRLQPGRDPESTFVDAYASMFGRAYHPDPGLSEVVDVRFTLKRRPDQSRSPASYNHQYPVHWYAATADRPDAQSGFSWSVLNGFDPTDLAAANLLVGEDRLVPLTNGREREEPDANPVYMIETVIGAVTELTAKNPDILVSLDAGEGAVMLEFDYEIQRGGRKTRLEAAVNHSLSFTASPQFQVPARGRYLRLPPDGGRQVQVQFRLRDAGMRTTATVGRLRVVRLVNPEQNATDRQAMLTSAGIGAGLGSAATLAAVAGGSALRRMFRAWRRRRAGG